MKILHLVAMDTGGAGRATIRINKSINDYCGNNVSSILVLTRIQNNLSINAINSNKKAKLKSIINNLINKREVNKYNTTAIFSNFKRGIDITNYELVKQSDIINLHWVNEGMISYNTLKKLSKLNKPIVWTLHDMWPFTGGCHYNEWCDRYKNTCGQCTILNSSKRNDLSTKIQVNKEKVYSNLNITVVGCSNWITQCAKESKLFNNNECINIPNPIDIEKFKPINKSLSKEILNICSKKKIILFGAMSSTSDNRKGFKYLLEAIKYLDKDKYIAVIFGNNTNESEIENYLETVYMGELMDDYTLTLLYSSADVFVAPSVQENLANTVMESLACGTPVVAFNIGGMVDMIKHKINGYIVEPFNSKSLANGIEYCIERYDELSNEARQYVVSNFTYEIIGKKYWSVYNNILKNI